MERSAAPYPAFVGITGGSQLPIRLTRAPIGPDEQRRIIVEAIEEFLSDLSSPHDVG